MKWRSKYIKSEHWSENSGIQFCAAIQAGLQEHHSVLELACDCLGFARLAITYLQEAKYTGVDSDQQQIGLGITHEMSMDLLVNKKPRFIYSLDNYQEVCSDKYDFIFIFNLLDYMADVHLWNKHIETIKELMHEKTRLIGCWSFMLDFKEYMKKNDMDVGQHCKSFFVAWKKLPRNILDNVPL